MEKKYAIVLIVVGIIISILFYFFVATTAIGPTPSDELKNDFENYLIDYVENANVPNDYTIKVYTDNGQNIFYISTTGLGSKLILNQDGSYDLASTQSYFIYYLAAIFLSLYIGFSLALIVLGIIGLVGATIPSKRRKRTKEAY